MVCPHCKKETFGKGIFCCVECWREYDEKNDAIKTYKNRCQQIRN